MSLIRRFLGQTESAHPPGSPGHVAFLASGLAETGDGPKLAPGGPSAIRTPPATHYQVIVSDELTTVVGPSAPSLGGRGSPMEPQRSGLVGLRPASVRTRRRDPVFGRPASTGRRSSGTPSSRLLPRSSVEPRQTGRGRQGWVPGGTPPLPSGWSHPSQWHRYGIRRQRVSPATQATDGEPSRWQWR